jgi:hypothetical protein
LLLPVLLYLFGWFASNAVMTDLVINFGLTATAIGNLTSAVQFGLF